MLNLNYYKNINLLLLILKGNFNMYIYLSLLGPKGCILFSDKKFSEDVDEACYPGY